MNNSPATFNERLTERPPHDMAEYDVWFRAKVQAALDDPRPSIPHAEVMAGMRARLEARRLAM